MRLLLRINGCGKDIAEGQALYKQLAPDAALCYIYKLSRPCRMSNEQVCTFAVGQRENYFRRRQKPSGLTGFPWLRYNTNIKTTSMETLRVEQAQQKQTLCLQVPRFERLLAQGLQR